MDYLDRARAAAARLAARRAAPTEPLPERRHYEINERDERSRIPPPSGPSAGDAVTKKAPRPAGAWPGGDPSFVTPGPSFVAQVPEEPLFSSNSSLSYSGGGECEGAPAEASPPLPGRPPRPHATKETKETKKAPGTCAGFLLRAAEDAAAVLAAPDPDLDRERAEVTAARAAEARGEYGHPLPEADHRAALAELRAAALLRPPAYGPAGTARPRRARSAAAAGASGGGAPPTRPRTAAPPF